MFRRAFNTGEIRNAAYRKHQRVIRQSFRAILDRHCSRFEVDCAYYPGDNPNVGIEQFFVGWSDVPFFYFAAEVFVKHRREQEMVVVADDCHVMIRPELEGGKEPAKSAAHDDDARFRVCH